MFATIIGAALPVILKLIEMWLTKKSADQKTVEAFYTFVKAMSGEARISAKIKLSFDKQIKRLEELQSKEAVKLKLD